MADNRAYLPRNFRIVHNGYKISCVHTPEEVEMYMLSVINEYKHLCPKKVMDRKLKIGNNQEYEYTRIVRYRYNTMYEEVFVIDF